MAIRALPWKCSIAVSIFLLLGLQVSATEDGSECSTDKTTKRFDVLPGRGWDNLRNVEQLIVLEVNFSHCRKSLDGRHFIPNYLELIPKKKTNMELFSEVFDSYRNYKSLTATSVNVEGNGVLPNGVTLGGSFSTEHQEVRTNQINSKSVTARVQLRHHLYTALAGQGMGLSRQFRDRLLDIGYQIHLNSSRQAAYLADLLVADFGTHVITRVDAGGVLWQRDSVRVDSNELTNKKTTQISASASVGFKMLFNLSVGVSHKSSDEYMKGYHNNLTHQKIGTHGGIPMKPGTSAGVWSDSVEDNLVAIDRAGDPLFYIVSPIYLGDTLPYQLIGQIKKKVKEAVLRYNRANSIIGCMDPGSKNFDPQANIPNSDCQAKRSNFTLGGVFQRCEGSSYLCQGHIVDNIITGSQSCPPGFQEVKISSRIFVCDPYCTGALFWTKCYDNCARYTIHWCAASQKELPPNSGYLFGGIYTARGHNPITGEKTCPPTFLTFTYGAGDITFCLSRDFELSSRYAVSFGGIFSCNSGNPYTVLPSKSSKNLQSSSGLLTLKSTLFTSGAAQWPKSCPRGYSQHLGFVDASCEMMFCMKSGELTRVQYQRVQRPPFVMIPEGSVPKPRVGLKLSAESGDWKFDTQRNTWEFEERSRLKTAVGVLGSLIGLMCVTLFIAILILGRRKYLQRRQQGEYQQLQSGPVETATSQQPV